MHCTPKLITPQEPPEESSMRNFLELDRFFMSRPKVAAELGDVVKHALFFRYV